MRFFLYYPAEIEKIPDTLLNREADVVLTFA